MKRIAVISALIFCHLRLQAQPALNFSPVVSGLSAPVDIVSANDATNRLFIVEQRGRIMILSGNSLSPTPFLDISTLVLYEGERGLLSLAFHPDYKTNGLFFVYYNDLAGNIRLARYRVRSNNPDQADAASGVTLLNFPKPFSNHNGAKLNFGPDGYLYFGTGDGGGSGDPFDNAQNPMSYLGKMFRINVSTADQPPYYSIPVGNPSRAGSLPEIIATGLRNPWRWSFDRFTADIWLADVGQGAWEELNMLPPDSILNVNFGWNCLEGTHAYKSGCSALTNRVNPIFEYSHNFSDGGYSIVGGYVYRGSAFHDLKGFYICSDFVSNNGWLISPRPDGSRNIFQLKALPDGISGYGESDTGEIYAVTLNGTVYQLLPGTPVRTVQLSALTATDKGLAHELHWQAVNQAAGDVFIVQRSNGAANSFTEIGRVTTQAAAASSFYTHAAAVPAAGDYYYRLKVFTTGGSHYYSNTVKLTVTGGPGIKAWLTDGYVQVLSEEPLDNIVLTDAIGRILYIERNLSAALSRRIPAYQLPRGIIFCKVATRSQKTSVFKLIN